MQDRGGIIDEQAFKPAVGYDQPYRPAGVQNFSGLMPVFHLAMFALVAKLDAPDWAKPAGYGWLFLDVTIGIMTLNHVPM